MGQIRLLTPLLYAKVSHPVKRWYDFYYPLALTVVVTATYWILTDSGVIINLYSERGVVTSVNSLVGILVGFFIAALAAVATFARIDMDKPMLGDPPTLKDTRLVGAKPIKLSRRMFLSLMFGYLTFCSLLIYVFGTVALAAYPTRSLIPGDTSGQVGNTIFVAAYVFALGNVASHTLLGMHYLSFRMHLSAKKVVKHEFVLGDEDDVEDDTLDGVDRLREGA